MTALQHELLDATIPRPELAPVTFLELEITGNCQLTCGHCYARSGPTGSHGTMTTADWENLLADAPAAGIVSVQFIGGEPLRHPGFAHLVEHALANGLGVQVFSNLFHVSEKLWELFSRPGVNLATSYYSDDPVEHDTVSGRDGSHARTLANITEAVRRGIPLRAGIIDLGDGQRVEQARDQLATLGIGQIRIDRMRGVGRGVRTGPPNVRELCGRCGDGRAAVSSDGDVWMCVLSRFLPSPGNVRTTRLADIFAGISWHNLLAQVPRRVSADGACNPNSDGNDCSPAETFSPPVQLGTPALRTDGACNPNSDGNDCSPAETISPPLLLAGIPVTFASAEACNPNGDSNDCSSAETISPPAQRVRGMAPSMGAAASDS